MMALSRLPLSRLPLNQLLRVNPLLCKTTSCLASNQSQIVIENDYFKKNERLARPMSPFVMYKPQLTTVLSITHRMTGLGLSVLLYTGGIAALFSSSTNFEHVLQTLTQTVPHPLLFAVKFLAGTSLFYHTANGLRHLCWDMGYGFGLKELYTSGYVVVALSLAAAVIIAIKA